MSRDTRLPQAGGPRPAPSSPHPSAGAHSPSPFPLTAAVTTPQCSISQPRRGRRAEGRARCVSCGSRLAPEGGLGPSWADLSASPSRPERRVPTEGTFPRSLRSSPWAAEPFRVPFQASDRDLGLLCIKALPQLQHRLYLSTKEGQSRPMNAPSPRPRKSWSRPRARGTDPAEGLSVRARAPKPPLGPHGRLPSAIPLPEVGAAGGRQKVRTAVFGGRPSSPRPGPPSHPPGSLDQDACKARGNEAGREARSSPLTAPSLRPSPPRAHTLSPGVIPARGSAGHPEAPDTQPAGWVARAAGVLVPGARRLPEHGSSTSPPKPARRRPRPQSPQCPACPRSRSAARSPVQSWPGAQGQAARGAAPGDRTRGELSRKGKPKRVQASPSFSRLEESRSHCRATKNTAVRAAPF
uniref:Uncharacterized protein n=1 Tax=Rangifer tarandus platyrhynchus TaxID=3082113 RepID=A0ACB0FN39_RANTA|nr:unnamed protein product [Rangifer tarandus platyrhynchus]